MSNFNGGFIIASKEAYDLLIELDYLDYTGNDWQNDNYFEISEDMIYCGDVTNSIKQFYINNKALSWDEPIQLSATNDLDDLPIGEENMQVIGNCILCYKYDEKCITAKEGLVCGNCISNGDLDKHRESLKIERLSITDKDGKVYEFEKPEFKCELLKVVKDKILGYIITNKPMSFLAPCYWYKSGFLGNADLLKEYSLIPIKPEKPKVNKLEIALMLMNNEKWISKEMPYGAYAFFDENLLGSKKSPFRYFTTTEVVDFQLWEDTEWTKY